MESFGDLARNLVMRTNQVRLREQLDTLATEVATGVVKDKATHLGGDTTLLSALDRSLARLEAFRVNTTEAKLISGAMQTALGGVQSQTETLANSLLSADLTPSPQLLATHASEARGALETVIGQLNTSVAGRSLFAGTATDSVALADADTMLAALGSEVAGAPDADSLKAAVAGFFAPGGTFETTLYTGSNDGLSPVQLSDTESASLDVRATDDALRQVLEPLAIAAIATDQALGLSTHDQMDVLGSAARDLLQAQAPVVELRASLGSLEARIDESAARNASERSATNMARLDLIGTDPFETATRYESARSQLESLYTITARSQRLSLANFL